MYFTGHAATCDKMIFDIIMYMYIHGMASHTVLCTLVLKIHYNYTCLKVPKHKYIYMYNYIYNIHNYQIGPLFRQN